MVDIEAVKLRVKARNIDANGHPLRGANVCTGWEACKHAPRDCDDSGQESQSDMTTPAGTIRSLINCFVSGGILGLAFLFKESGSGTTMIALVVCAALIYITMMMLWDASTMVGTTGFLQTAEKIWGHRIGKLALLSLIAEQLGTVILYFNVLRDTLPRVLQQNIVGCVESDEGCDVPFYIASWCIIAVLTVFFIAPLSCLSKPDVFASISFFTWVHFGAFLVLVIVEATTQAISRGTFWPPEPNGPFQMGEAMFSTIAVIGFSMAAHSTLLPLLYGTKLPSDEKEQRQTIVKINLVSIVGVLVYYFVVASAFFIAFGTSVKENSLNSFPENHVFMQVIRCTYTIEIGTSIPLFVYTLRRNTFALLLGLKGSQDELNKIEHDKPLSKTFLTLVLLALSAAAGILLDLNVILGFAGAVCASLNSFIFPAGMFWMAAKGGKEESSIRRRFVAPCMVIFGGLLLVVSLIFQIKGLAEK